MSYPPILHKYAEQESALAILTKRSLKVSAPESFNDIHEMTPIFGGTIDKEAYRQYLSDPENISAFYEEIPKHLTIEQFSAAIQADFENRYACIDHAKVIADAKFLFEDAKRKYYTLCLSELNNSPLMWAHYSQNHTGVVLSFNVREWGTGKEIYEVKYPDKRAIISLDPIFAKDPIQLVNEYKNALITKGPHWEYEQEYRCFIDEKSTDFELVTPKEGLPYGLWTFKPEQLNAIIFGYRCLKDMRNKVQAIVTPTAFPNVRYMEARPHPTTFEITVDYI